MPPRHPRCRPLHLFVSILGLALLAGVSVGVVLLPSSAQADDQVHPEWGSTQGPSGYLYRGCHTYTYSYTFKPPAGQWAAEVFITGPTGAAVASGAFLDGGDPLVGQGVFKLCYPTTPAGTFTINVKLSVDGDGTAGHQEGYLTPSTFTLTKQPRTKHPRPDLTLGPFRIQ